VEHGLGSIARPGQVHGDLGVDPPGPAAQDQDPVGEHQRLIDVVRDK
jgi:hypothetical protein